MSIMPSHRIADLFDTHHNMILLKWKEQELVRQTLARRGIDSDFFFKHFGPRVLNYFSGILRQENTPGHCPVILVMLKFFQNYHISLDETYTICSGNKNAVITFMLDQNIEHNDHEFKEIIKLFDTNFSGVMRELIKQEKPLAQKASATDQTDAAPSVEFATSEHSEIRCSEYGCEYDYSDLQEFAELEEEIISLSDKLLQGSETASVVNALAQKFAKFSSAVLMNPTYIELAGSFFQLSALFTGSSNLQKIEKDLPTYSLLLDCMINDLVIWRKNLLTHTVDTHYYDASLISNIQQMSRMLEEESNDVPIDIEFF